eukprot:tig00000383_g24702.t1
MGELVVGTVRGLFRVSLSGGAPSVTAAGEVLREAWISHIAVDGGQTLAAVMKLARVHRMYDRATYELGANAGREGLYLVEGGSTSSSSERRLLAGDVKACALSADPRFPVMYAGLEPAAVQRSVDGGATWQNLEALQRVPSRGRWTFPVPPHQPHVLSLDLLPTWDASQAPGKDLLVGVEVGGVFRSGNAGESFSEHNGPAMQGKEDVHSCRPDPHRPGRWYAVTGYGFFRTETAGERWERVSTGGGGYCVGLAVCPSVEDTLAVTSADSPPGVGNAVVSISRDGGRSFRVLECGERLEATPVPLWVGGTLVVGAMVGGSPSRGALLRVSGDGGRLERLCELPAGVTCLAARGSSPSSVMH